MNDFKSCMSTSDSDMDKTFKSYASLTVAEGRIRPAPLAQKKIKAFNHWVQDKIRLGVKPSSMAFPVQDIVSILDRAQTYKIFIDSYEVISAVAKPGKFTKDMKWEEWSTVFINYLRTIPGRNGVPLKYVIREDSQPRTVNTDFLDDYVQNAPLVDEAFSIDSAVVHTFLVSFVSQNEQADGIIKIYESEINGRKDWQPLTQHYEGVGIFSYDIVNAERNLEKLHYSGEKKPVMWLALFERRLTNAF